MTTPITFGELEFNLVADMENTVATPDSRTPFRILIMGDFSGRDNRGGVDIDSNPAWKNPIQIDRDNFDAVMEKLGVRLSLSVLGENAPSVDVRFLELDDFHPDQLYNRLEVFSALKDTRKSLQNPATFSAMTDQLRRPKGSSDHLKPSKPLEIKRPKPSDSDSGDLLDQIISETPGQMDKPNSLSPRSEWHSFLQEIVAPHLVSHPDPRQGEMIAAVDAAIGELMRMILHHPHYAKLEASWKALHLLTTRLETDVLLKVYLLDISKSELAGNLMGAEDLRSTDLYKLLVGKTVETPGADPWAILIGNYHFLRNPDDIILLGRIAKMAKAGGAPFISAANDGMICKESLVKTPDPDDWKPIVDEDTVFAWNALRRLPESDHLGLVLPRFLLRLPYGGKTDPIDSFEFEEIGVPINPSNFLWGNPAFACALLMGLAFSRNGWSLVPGELLEIDNMPLFVYKQDGESGILPCAEVLLTQHAAEKILDEGLMPLLSFLNQDLVRLGRFQAISLPATRLSGRWGK